MIIQFLTTVLLVFFGFIAQASVNYEVFTHNGKQGLKDTSGKIVIPPQFDALGWTLSGDKVKNNRIGFLKDGKWGLVSTNNEILYKAAFDAVFDANSNYIVTGEKQADGRFKAGLVDYTGKKIIPHKYSFLKIYDTNIIASADQVYGLLDFNNNIIIPFEYDQINSAGDLRWLVWKENKAAIFSSNGTRLTDFALDSLKAYENGLAVAWVGHRAGVVNREGKWITPAEYKKIEIEKRNLIATPYNTFKLLKKEGELSLSLDSIRSLENGYFIAFASGNQWLVDAGFERVSHTGSDIKISKKLVAVKEGGFYRIYHLGSNELWSDEYYKDVKFISNNLLLLKSHASNLWMLHGSNSNAVNLTDIQEFHVEESGIKVRKNDHWGFYTFYGDEVLPPVYENISPVKHQKFIVKFHNNHGIVNQKEDWLVPPIDENILDFNNSHYISFNGKNYNLYSYQGKRIYFSKYPLLLKNNYVMEQMEDQQSRRINFNGVSIKSAFGESGYQEILPLQEGFIGIYHQGMYGFIDPQNRLRIANRYDGIQSFREGLASVKLRGKWGVIDKAERLLIQPMYDSVGYFINGIAYAKLHGQYGLINSAGDIMLPFEYDAVYSIDEDYLAVKKNGSLGVATNTGKILIWPKYDDITFKNGYFIVKKGKYYGLHDIEGLAVEPPVYNKIIPVGNGQFIFGEENEKVKISLR